MPMVLSIVLGTVPITELCVQRISVEQIKYVSVYVGTHTLRYRYHNLFACSLKEN